MITLLTDLVPFSTSLLLSPLNLTNRLTFFIVNWGLFLIMSSLETNDAS